MKTKEKKLQFLEKVLDYLKMRLQIIHIDLRPNKVVAGLEPEKTNYFLQLLATLALHLVDVVHINSNKVNSIDENNEGDELIVDVDKYNIAKATNEVTEQESKDEPLVIQDNEKRRSELIEAERNEEREKDKSIESDSRPTSTKIDEEKSLWNAPEEIKKNYNDEAKSTNHVIDTRFNAHGKETIDDESKVDKSNIQHRFFGTNEFQEETITDDSKPYVRPKTARRRPPRIKERIPSADSTDCSNEMKKPVIFKGDDDGFFLNLYERSQKLDGLGR